MGAARIKKLLESVKHRAMEQHNGIYVPRVQGDTKREWPVCLTCHRDVDSVNVEDFSKHSVDIRAKCHGEECTIRLEFPYHIINRSDEDTWHHIRTAINNSVFFEPSIA